MQGLELVAYVQEHPGITPGELQAQLGAGERTARGRIAQANERLAGSARIAYDRASRGYLVRVADDARFDALMSEVRDQRPDPFDRLPSTPDQRVAYLLQDLLQRSGYITLDDLASLIFVSRSTCSASLKGVREKLAEFGLELESRPRHGLKVTGPEMGRRLCLASLAVKNLLADDPAIGAVDPTAPGRLQAISGCVQRVLDARDFKVNPMAHQNLIVHIAIALARIDQGAYVPMDPGNVEQIAATGEFEVARAIAGALERDFGVDLPEEEVAYIAIHLAGKRSGQMDAADDSLVVDDEAWEVAGRMIEVVYRAYRFDFRDDVELRMNLARHIMPLSVRLRYHMQIANPMLTDIRARLSLAFSMAVDASTVLTESYGVEPTEEEIGYLALSFALAAERLQSENPPKRNVLVVCASGAGSARLLAYRVQREFGNYIGRVSTCDAADVSRWDYSEIDYVFTTVPLDWKPPVPVLQITLFLDEDDRSSAESALSAPRSAGMGEIIRPELFCGDLDAATPEEAISALVALAARSEDLPGNFEQLVLEREAMAATSFGNLTAIPHPREAASERTFVCVGVLAHEVDWGGRPVRVVLLVSAAAGAGGGLDEFYRVITHFLSKQESVNELIEHRDYETLMNELKG